MSVTFQPFGKTTAGEPVRQAILKNARIEVRVISYAAIITNLIVMDRHGDATDVVLGYPTAQDYELNAGDAMGAAVGRFANRIGGAKFTLDGKEYHVTHNQSGNCLHSGLHGLHHTLFTMGLTEGESDSVTLTARLPDGVDGFPGNMEVEIEYRLVDAGLMIRYHATTDAPTVCNLTNHSYFNLNGHDSGSVLGHRVTMASDAYLETDDASVPTGAILPVRGTPMDFGEEKTLGRDINDNYPALVQGKGYDHCYIIRDSGLRHAAWVTGPESGIRMEVLTTLPAVQLYTGNYLAPVTPCKEGAAYQERDGVCLETQDYPDAPNKPAFPDTTLRPGKPYSATTIYRFELAPLY